MTRLDHLVPEGLRRHRARRLRLVRDPASSMLPVDFDPDGLQIVACPRCEDWWAEVVRDRRDNLVVREWHAAACDRWPSDEVERAPER